jgi:hypothetical protein
MIPLPYLLGGALLSVLLALGGGYWLGRSDGRALEAGEQDRATAAVVAAQAAMVQVAAESIAKIEVRNVHTTQKLEKETVEVPVYRDCRHSPDALGLLNDALSGPEAGFGTGDGRVPDAGPAD